MPTDRHNLLITGLPGTGKTTLLMELARRFSSLKPAGFYTEEVREKGIRRGFRFKSLDGHEGILADVEIRGPHHVGRYGVDLQSFDHFLSTLDLSSHPSQLVFVDEIGKMECLSHVFVQLVETLLSSEKTVIATVALKGEGAMGKVKARPDVELVEVTRANRQALPDQLTRWLERKLSIPTLP